LNIDLFEFELIW